MRCLLLPLVVALTYCSTPVPVHFGVHRQSAPAVTIPDPAFDDGDPVAGRRAFIALGCIDCHRVAKDAELPTGRRAEAGPLLRGLSRYAPNQLARLITSRNAGSEEGPSDRMMKDYAQSITARQLVDIVAYLRNPPMPPG
jgi:mono/diheme cytochrome c family protein